MLNLAQAFQFDLALVYWSWQSVMEFGPDVADIVLFPTAVYRPEVTPADDTSEQPSWDCSETNPVNKINSHNAPFEPAWDIDGVEADGQLFWATPKFARDRPPRWIDLHWQGLTTDSPELSRLLEVHKIPLVPSAARVRLGVGQHILGALNYWSSHTDDFETKYMSAPLGSQIFIDKLRRNVASISITLVPRYDLERQWLQLHELQRIWKLPADSIPDSIDIDRLLFKRRLHYTICIVGVDGQPSLGDVVFKSHMLDVNSMYREIRNLLALPEHPNLQRNPLLLVTKRVSFGGKRGVCGYITKLHPEGSLDQFMIRSGQHLSLETKLKLAAEVTRGLIKIRDSPLRYFADLKLDNVVIETNNNNELETHRAVLIDFEQGTPWFEWAPPEVYWVNFLERIATASVGSATQLEHLKLIQSLIPEWTPQDRQARYGSGSRVDQVAWAHLSNSEKTSAVVYMLGKFIWCLMEGVVQMSEPITFGSFVADPAAPVFPTFRNTPPALQECIRRCTSGAIEWRNRQQPFQVRGGLLRLKDPCVTGDGPGGVQWIQPAARNWWRHELEDAKKFVRLRVHGVENAVDQEFLAFMHGRPTMEEILQAIRDSETYI